VVIYKLLKSHSELLLTEKNFGKTFLVMLPMLVGMIRRISVMSMTGIVAMAITMSSQFPW